MFSAACVAGSPPQGEPGVGSAGREESAGLRDPFEYRRVLMGVEARVLIATSESEAAAREAAEAAFDRIAELEQVASDWRADSELRQLEEAFGSGPVKVSGELFGMVLLGAAIAQHSEGAFDPTCAPITRMWRAARESGVRPSDEALAEASARVGFSQLSLDGNAGTISAPAGVQMDLGGVAKGYAAGAALHVLDGRGFPSALVDLGGDLALGAPPSAAVEGAAKGWRVQLGEGGEVRELSNVGVATSGPDEQKLVANGVELSHLIDPKTGAATTHGRSITVIASDPGVADVLATATSCMEPSAAEDLIAHLPATEWIVSGGAEEAERSPVRSDWRSIFDGTSFAGWTRTGGRYDGDAVWEIEDGCLTGRTGPNGEGGLIYTEQPYGSFELEGEVLMDYPFDSGLFYHMLPPDSGLRGGQVTLDHRPDGEVGAIYADGFLSHCEEGGELYRRGEWNHVRLRVVGIVPRVQFWLNNELLTDYQLGGDAEGFASSGLIGLQVHGADPAFGDNRVRFRSLRVRELGAFADERISSFRDFFAGGLEDFEAIGDADGYVIEDGELFVPATGGGHLISKQDVGDGRFAVDFRISRMANSGLFLHGSREGGDPAYAGFELQILDDFNWEAETGSQLAPYQKTGGLYAAVAPAEHKLLHPVGEWNRYEVLMRGPRVAVALNGRVLYDVNTFELDADPPFADRPATGFIGFQRYGAPNVDEPWAVRFRRARLAPADPK